MEKAVSCVEELGQKINSGLQVNDMLEVQTGNKLHVIEFGSEQKFEANKKL